MKNKNFLKLILSSLFVCTIVACGGNVKSTNVSKTSTNSSLSTNSSTNSSSSTSSSTISSSSSSSTAPEEKIDYVNQTKILTDGWKEKSFMNDGVGVVTLFRTVDGDTAHFKDGSKVIQIRFNGVNTPESTGTVEPWGYAASRYTKEQLKNAKTIVIETEPNENKGGPVADSTGTRYMGWVWISDKTVDEEDGSTLRLLNLMLIDGSYSATKGVAGSAYAQTFYDCDLQAQKDKLRIWSNDLDPDFYYGSAIPTDLKEISTNPDDYLGKRVVVEGVVTRTMGENAYIQEVFDDEESGNYEVYGAYIFTMYRDFSEILSKGNRVRVIGVIGEYPEGSKHIEIADVQYSELFPDEDNDMKLISTDNPIEPMEMTPAQALVRSYFNTLVKFKNITVTGGYGGTDEGEDDNAMTLYAKDSNNNEFNIRIDKSTFIKDLDGEVIKSYRYFVGKNFDVTGIVGYYESIYSGKQQYQLMLVATSDLTYL